MKILERVELLKSKNESDPLKFRIIGGILGGIEYIIEKVEAEDDSTEVKIDFVVSDDKKLLDAAIELVKVIVQDDFLARIDQSLEEIDKETDVKNS